MMLGIASYVKSRVKVIIRVDDVGWGLNKRIDYLMADYANFHKLFKERNMPYCPCIIPAVCDKDMVGWMHDNFYPEVTPCLHGWNHERSMTPDDEFGGLQPIITRRRVLAGIEELQPLTVYGMSAPWNRYSSVLTDACKEAGLKFFLAGYGREKPEVFKRDNDGFTIIPATPSIYVRGGDSVNTIKALRELPKDNKHPYVLTLHCIWEYPNLGDDRLTRLLDVLMQEYDVLDVKKWLTKF